MHVYLGEIIGMMNKLYTKLFGTWKTTDELFYNDSVDGPSCIVVQKNSKSNKERAYVDHFWYNKETVPVNIAKNFIKENK